MVEGEFQTTAKSIRIEGHVFVGFQQELGGKDGRIADYFDVIAETSTGGLLTTMLTALDENNCPMIAAKDINQFYKESGPKIFHKRVRNSVPLTKS